MCVLQCTVCTGPWDFVLSQEVPRPVVLPTYAQAVAPLSSTQTTSAAGFGEADRSVRKRSIAQPDSWMAQPGPSQPEGKTRALTDSDERNMDQRMLQRVARELVSSPQDLDSFGLHLGFHHREIQQTKHNHWNNIEGAAWTLACQWWDEIVGPRTAKQEVTLDCSSIDTDNRRTSRRIWPNRSVWFSISYQHLFLFRF